MLLSMKIKLQLLDSRKFRVAKKTCAVGRRGALRRSEGHHTCAPGCRQRALLAIRRVTVLLGTFKSQVKICFFLITETSF